MVKTVYVTLSDEEHERLKEEKERLDKTWADFLLMRVNGEDE